MAKIKNAPIEQQICIQNHESIRKADNKKILRRQLELLAEYSRTSYGHTRIPVCSREMVRIYRELVKTENRSIFFYAGLLGIIFSFLYGFGIKFVKFCKR